MNIKNSNGSILIFIIIISILLLASFLLYNQITKNNLFESGAAAAAIKNKNAISNALSMIIKLFDNDTMSNCDGQSKFWLKNRFDLTLGDVNLTIRFADEDSKINLNLLLYPDGKINSLVEKQVVNILRNHSIPTDYVNYIIDWIDRDDEPMNPGAEKDYYKTQSNLTCANDEFRSLDELKLLKDIGKYFNDDISDTANLYNYFTIYGDNQYNINTIAEETLDSFDFLDKVEISAILEFRKKFDINNIEQLPKLIPELQNASFDLIDGYLKTSSAVVRIDINAEYSGFKTDFYCVYNKFEKRILLKKYCN